MHSNHLFRRFRFLAALVGIITAAIILFSCTNNQKNISEKTTSSSEQEVAFSNSLSDYTIVRADNSGNPLLKQALDLRAAIQDQSKINLPLSTDHLPDAGKPEILVGMTNRQASIDTALELTESTNFIVKTVGNKIVLLANTQKGMSEAIEYLRSEYNPNPSQTNYISQMNHVEYSDDIIFVNQNQNMQFVLPEGASTEFTACAKAIIDSYNIPEFTLVNQSQFESEHAVYIGTIHSDPISTSYADIINENEYTARLAANNIYLQGEDNHLTLLALGEVLNLLCQHLDYDFEKNLWIGLPNTINFSKTWNYDIPKPITGDLERYESISSNSYVIYYSGVTGDSYTLFKKQLQYWGFYPDPIVSYCYQSANTSAILNYKSTDCTLSVTIFVNSKSLELS